MTGLASGVWSGYDNELRIEEHPSDALKTKYSQPLTTYITTSPKLWKILNTMGLC